jgi:hypothetical protein
MTRVIGVACIALMLSVPMLAQPPGAVALRAASLIFTGVVDRVGASAIQDVPGSDNTIVVKVMDVVARPPAVALKHGDPVTVRVMAPGQLRQGDRAVFYCEGWIIGKGLAVIETGHEIIRRVASGGGGDEAAKDRARQLVVTAASQSLRQRVDDADGVFRGRVIRIVEPSKQETRGRARSEHDPDWQYATVTVETVLKLWTPNDNIVVRFPGSSDSAWSTLKLAENEEDVLLVKRIHGAHGCGASECPTAELVGVLTRSELDSLLPDRSSIRMLSSLVEWQAHIEWCINDAEPGAAISCPGDYPPPSCAVSGGRRCLMAHAVRSAKNSDCAEAMRLTLICQCGNVGARQSLAAAGEQAVCEYLREK